MIKMFNNPLTETNEYLYALDRNSERMAKFIADINTIERMNILFYSSLLTGFSMIAVFCYEVYNIHMNDYLVITLITGLTSIMQASQLYGMKAQDLKDVWSPSRLVNASPYWYLAMACFFALLLPTNVRQKDISCLNAVVFTGLTYSVALFLSEQLFQCSLHIKKRDIIAKAEKIDLEERFNESIFTPVHLNPWLRRNPQAENRPHLE
jgi:hypothetical protein